MKKLFKIYLSAIKDSFNAICRSWLIIPFSAILLFVSNIILSLLVRIGPNGGFSVGGFLAGMFTIFAMSIFYHFLSIAASSQKLRFSDIKDINFSFFSPILNVAFILFIVNLLASAIFATNNSLIIILNFVIVILCNPAPECIILKNYYGTETLTESFKFIKNYYIEWFLPYIIFFLPLLLINFNEVLLLFGFNDVLIPGNIFYKGSFYLFNLINFNIPIITILLSFILALFFSIFRIYLFEELDGKIRR